MGERLNIIMPFCPCAERHLFYKNNYGRIAAKYVKNMPIQIPDSSSIEIGW
jgi:hypothetical protein